jgi:hypothetical protein
MLSEIASWVLVVHTCNPRYSGGREQEDCILKPAWANSLPDHNLKNAHYKRRLVKWLKV